MTGNSIFDHISKLMGRELNTSALEQREILFEKLMGFTKALFCIHIIGLRLSGLKVPLISETDLYGIFIVTGYEASAIVMDSKKYKLAEENTIFALNCLKILKEIPTKLYIAFFWAQHCITDDCFDLARQIAEEEIGAKYIELKTFYTWLNLKETRSFDKFVRYIYEQNRSGMVSSCPTATIIEIILNGRASDDSSNILLQLLDFDNFENVDSIHLSRILAETGKLDQFKEKFRGKLPSYIQTLEKTDQAYRILKRIAETDILDLSMSMTDFLEHYNFVNINKRFVREFFEVDHVVYEELMDKIMQLLEKIFTACLTVTNEIMKLSYMKFSVLLLMTKVCKFDNSIKRTNFEPLLDFMLRPEAILNKVHRHITLVSLKSTIALPSALVTKQTLSKFVDVFNAYPGGDRLELISSLRYAAFASIFDQNELLKRYKLVHQVCMERGIDFGQSLETLTPSIIKNLDLNFSKDFLDYIINHRLISKSAILFFKKYIKTQEDMIDTY